eukprot:253122_1
MIKPKKKMDKAIKKEEQAKKKAIAAIAKFENARAEYQKSLDENDSTTVCKACGNDIEEEDTMQQCTGCNINICESCCNGCDSFGGGECDNIYCDKCADIEMKETPCGDRECHSEHGCCWAFHYKNCRCMKDP